MNDADLGRLDQRLADDLDQMRGLVERDRTASADRLGERVRAFDLLHRDPRLLATLATRDHVRDARALHALELLELALEPLRDARQSDDLLGDDLDDARLSRRFVDGFMDRAGATPAQFVAELEPRRQRILRGCLSFHRHEPSGVNRAEVRVVAELLVALGAELHCCIPLGLARYHTHQLETRFPKDLPWHPAPQRLASNAKTSTRRPAVAGRTGSRRSRPHRRPSSSRRWENRGSLPQNGSYSTSRIGCSISR